MSKGFRKSLFGFNTEDVLKYISASDNAAKTKISKLEKEIIELNSKIEAIEKEKAELYAVAEEYKNKKEYIKLMTDNTARIYLAAKSTSKLMIDNANESRKLIEEANDTRISALSDVQEAMKDLREKINTASKSYSDEVDELSIAFENLKNCINDNNSESDSAVQEFNTLANKNI